MSNYEINQSKVNVEKVEFGLEHGTDAQKKELLDKIYQLNLKAEEIWFEVKTNAVSHSKPSVSRKTQLKAKITLYEIECIEKSTKNYYDENGFVYTKKHKKANATYFRCRHSKSEGCRASVICHGNLEDAILSIPHEHGPDEKDVDRLTFSKKLEEIINETPFKTAMEVYTNAKEALLDKIDMTHIGELENYAVFIHRKRKQDIPLLSKTIKEFEEMINDPQYKQRYMYDYMGKLFFHGVWRGPAGSNVVFISDTVLRKTKTLKTVKLLMDGTFKSLPHHLQFRQLYIISVVIEDRCYPLAYILMEKKDASSYKLIFNKIKKMIPNTTVTNCMSDYEAATRKAIREIFPKTILSGCYFHYVQAIVKKFKKFGMNKDDTFKDARNQVTALALLPNDYIIPGFAIISRSFKKCKIWKRFADYWMTYWSEANISVYGLRHRTNNFAESLNKTLNSINKSRHPNIWQLIRNLRTVNWLKSDELKKVMKGHMVKTKRNRKMKALNKKIKKATKLFNNTGDVKSFLKKVTFQENLDIFYNQRMDYYSDVDDDDDEIIPNDFNIKSNFRKNFPRLAAGKRKSECVDCEPMPKKQKL